MFGSPTPKELNRFLDEWWANRQKMDNRLFDKEDDENVSRCFVIKKKRPPVVNKLNHDRIRKLKLGLV